MTNAAPSTHDIPRESVTERMSHASKAFQKSRTFSSAERERRARIGADPVERLAAPVARHLRRAQRPAGALLRDGPVGVLLLDRIVGERAREDAGHDVDAVRLGVPAGVEHDAAGRVHQHQVARDDPVAERRGQDAAARPRPGTRRRARRAARPASLERSASQLHAANAGREEDRVLAPQHREPEQRARGGEAAAASAQASARSALQATAVVTRVCSASSSAAPS